MSDSFGSWQLDALLAVGGLGEVWRARRERSGELELAAVKRLHTHLIRNDDARAQFALEQRLTTTLPHHPNLVHAIEAEDVEGRPYVALELVPGEDLRRIVIPPPSDAPEQHTVIIPRSRAIAIVVAACDGAAHLHAHGWIHGDINPSNLVIDPQPTGDRVVLVDLGVSRPIDEAGTVRGTHAYMAPEQIRGEAWTRASDVFALGVVMWELAAGKRLFHRGPPWLSMAAVIESEVPALPDAALDAVVRAALAKDAAARTPTPAELAAALRAL